MSHKYRSAPLVALTCAFPLAFAAPAAADPTIGLGVTFSFGGGQIDTGVGLRVFHNNRRNSTVGSVGLDYMLASQQFRGTVGVAALRRNVFVGVDVGYSFGSGTFNFGPSLGVTNTSRPPAPLIVGNGGVNGGNGDSDFNPVGNGEPPLITGEPE